MRSRARRIKVSMRVIGASKRRCLTGTKDREPFVPVLLCGYVRGLSLYAGDAAFAGGLGDGGGNGGGDAFVESAGNDVFCAA